MAVDFRPTSLHELVLPNARKDFVALRQDMTVHEALTAIRQQIIGEKIVYFYVQDDADHLVGVLPIRRLLAATEEQRLADMMIRRVVSIPQTATVVEACEFFILYKFLAFPVVDKQQHILGVVDVSLFTEEIFDVVEREQAETIFETLGFRMSEIKDASALKAFSFRFPWLLTTIVNGTLCAMLTSVYEMTLAQHLVLTFFLTMVLGLNESVSIQSMTVTIQALRVLHPTFQWYLNALKREMATALMLGGACGTVVAGIARLWHGEWLPALVIGGGIWLSLLTACLFGLSIPTLLHAFRLDPKVASGPITLALTDICALLFYFTLAAVLL